MGKTRMMGLLAAAVVMGIMGTAVPVRGADEPIDWTKAQGLHQKEVKGETLTADEQAYLDRAKAAMQRGDGPGRQQQGNQAPGGQSAAGKDSMGFAPLTDLTEKYKGEDGGLYGGGKNEPPAEQLKRAMAAAGKIRPLDKDGKAAEDGKIVLLSIGMSNTTAEFARFKQDADADSAKNPKLVIVDGAQGGMDAKAWVEGRKGPNGELKAEDVWGNAGKRMEAAQVSPKQVQAVWIKQALMSPALLGEFPKSSDVLKDDIVKILQMAKEHYPNLQVAYLSNRIYAGYAVGPLNPEPYAYESAFADRGVIEMQMKGDPGLNSDAAKGAVKAPVVLWGPYMWADGVKGRKGDDLVWKREDLGPDGTHPSETGREKVSQMLLKFFKTDTTAKGWFTKG